MSIRLGAIKQCAYIVKDIDEALEYWINALGVGPFFKLPRTSFSSCFYKGQESNPVLDVALGNWGEMQIEIIQQVNDAPSMYTDFIRDHGAGMQHMSTWSENYDADRAKLKALQFKTLMEGVLSHGTRVMFFDACPHAGAVVELMELTAPVRERMDFVRQAALNWDGTDPVRFMARREAVT